LRRAKNITFVLVGEVLLISAEFYLCIVLLFHLHYKEWGSYNRIGSAHRALAKEWIAGPIVTATLLLTTSIVFIVLFTFSAATFHFLAGVMQWQYGRLQEQSYEGEIIW